MGECPAARQSRRRKKGFAMLIDRYDPEDVFARVPELADQTDPVLVQLDGLLDDDQLYAQVRADLAHRYRLTLVHGRHSTPAEGMNRPMMTEQHQRATIPRGGAGFKCLFVLHRHP
jgi:hypothetical protein